MNELVRTLETEYKYSTEQASEIVKSKKGFVHVSMESKLQKDGSKKWRIVGYKQANFKTKMRRLVRR